jgi:general stress protein 26
MDETEDATRATIWRHAEAIGTCMMVIRTDAGILARPMRGVIASDANLIWFFTDRTTETALHAERSCSCCLTYADVKTQTFVSLSGELSLVDDRAEIARLWTEGAAVYFPRGIEDRSLVLLRFAPDNASYWDAPSNPVVLAIKFLQAKATGKRPALGVQQAVAMV